MERMSGSPGQNLSGATLGFGVGVAAASLLGPLRAT